MGSFNLYINNKNQKYFDELKVCAEGNDKTVSTAICKAIRQYLVSMDYGIQLIADMEDLNKFIKGASQKELREMHTLIYSINEKIMKKAWK